MSVKGIQTTALIVGSFLSGTMASLSLVAVPVLLDSTASGAQLCHAWARMYHYGHQVLPSMSVGTLGLWAYAAAKQRASKKQWKLSALAGAVTVLMIPFTWFFMAPTNNTLFSLEANQAMDLTVSFEEVRPLVTLWTWMHLFRSAFPLAGAIVGVFTVLNR